MYRKNRKNYTAEENVAILRRQRVDQGTYFPSL